MNSQNCKRDKAGKPKGITACLYQGKQICVVLWHCSGHCYSDASTFDQWWLAAKGVHALLFGKGDIVEFIVDSKKREIRYKVNKNSYTLPRYQGCHALNLQTKYHLDYKSDHRKSVNQGIPTSDFDTE